MIRINLPRPISTNNLFGNSNGGRKKTVKYNIWRSEAEEMILKQRPIQPIVGPVSVVIEVGETGVSSEMDIDNTSKAYLDALVWHGIIEDDNRKIIRQLLLKWVQNKQGATITINKLQGQN